MKIISLKLEESTLEKTLHQQIEKLSRTSAGLDDVWRYVLYSYGKKEKHQTAIDALIAYISNMELRRLNIRNISTYLSAEQKSTYEMLYEGIVFCEANHAMIEKLIHEKVAQAVDKILKSKKSLTDYMSNNGITFSSPKGIGYCQLHKFCMGYQALRQKHCLIKNDGTICSNFLFMRSPFWQSKLGQSILSKVTISNRARYRD